MKMNYSDIGRRIRKVRRDKHMTQEQLAEIIGVGTTHISHIETGNTIASMKLFVAIVDALGVSADELLRDNLAHAKEAFIGEIFDELQDCSEEEVRFIADMVRAMKIGLRKRIS